MSRGVYSVRPGVSVSVSGPAERHSARSMGLLVAEGRLACTVSALHSRRPARLQHRNLRQTRPVADIFPPGRLVGLHLAQRSLAGFRVLDIRHSWA